MHSQAATRAHSSLTSPATASICFSSAHGSLALWQLPHQRSCSQSGESAVAVLQSTAHAVPWAVTLHTQHLDGGAALIRGRSACGDYSTLSSYSVCGHYIALSHVPQCADTALSLVDQLAVSVACCSVRDQECKSAVRRRHPVTRVSFAA